MLKLLSAGIIGACATLTGLWLNLYLAKQDSLKPAGEDGHVTLVQLKTEMTGIPVVVDGNVSGYLVFQLGSTIDSAKLPSKEFDVAPYLLDSAIRSSYQSTVDGSLNFNAAFLEKLSRLIREDANKKLSAEAVVEVNVQQFNFVPKEDVRGNVLAGNHKE